MDRQLTPTKLINRALSGPNSPANVIRHQKSVSDSAAFDISMLKISTNTTDGSSSSSSPTSHSLTINPKRFSTYSDSSAHTTLTLSSSVPEDTTDSSVSSSRGEPTPTRVDKPHSPVSRTRVPIRTFSTPAPPVSHVDVDQDQPQHESRNAYDLATSAAAAAAAAARWQLTDAMMRAQIESRNVPGLKPWTSIHPHIPKVDEPGLIYGSHQHSEPLEASLVAWQAHQLGLHQQLLQNYTRFQHQQQNQAHVPLSHSRSPSHQSSQSTDSSRSISTGARLPSVLDAYNAELGLNPYLGLSSSPRLAATSSLLARARLAQQVAAQQHSSLTPEQEIEAAEKELARQAANFNNSRFVGPHALLDAQSLQQAAITMAYTGQTLPLLSLYGISPEIAATQPGLTNAIAKLVSLRAGENLESGDINGGGAHQRGFGGPSASNKKTNLYKTELCRSWEEKGSCRYGAKCQFAHGQEELRPVSRHPKFKTEICRTFWLHGSCPYGKRCCFLHTNNSTEAGNGANPNEPTTSNEPATSRLQQRTSGLASSVAAYMEPNSTANPTEAPGPRSRLERLRPVSASGTSSKSLLRSAPVLSRHTPKNASLSSVSFESSSAHRFSSPLSNPNHQEQESKRPSSALSDRSSSLLTPFTGHRSTASSPTELSTTSLSPSAHPFAIKN